ncbi:hypothetical protein CK203_038000 [Vitis vinifera]|uniref:Uncharacterized protein n=1 Tax=Vitis vinifera TaxID=29760 RepID=A0A438HNT4_VITVI|nr:hypothetical protein CK203_038000 [Vitis vinifera]
MPDGTYLGLDGMIPNKLHTCPRQPKGLEFERDTWRGTPHNAPLTHPLVFDRVANGSSLSASTTSPPLRLPPVALSFHCYRFQPCFRRTPFPLESAHTCLRFPYGLKPLSMTARGGVASTSESEWEFWACFHILDNIPIHLIDNEALSSVDQPNNAMYFTKEQFVTGLCLPLPFLFKQFLHFTQIPPVFVHPNVV